MSICGIAASISSFKDDIIAKISGFLDLKETLGTLPGIDTLKSLLPAGLASLKDKLQGMLPDIPISTSAFSSLRSDLGSIVGSASAFASGLSGFVSKYSGITSLRGMANINLSDLANSAFSLGGSFDPCSSDIPNVLSGADGLEKLAASAPKLGETILAAKQMIEAGPFEDLYAASQAKIVTLVESMDVDTLNSTIASNIQQAKNQFTDGSVQKLTTGVEQLLTKVAFVADVMAESVNIVDESTEQYA